MSLVIGKKNQNTPIFDYTSTEGPMRGLSRKDFSCHLKVQIKWYIF